MKYKVLEQKIFGRYNLPGSQHAVCYEFKLMDEEKNVLEKSIERNEYKGASVEDCVGKVIEETKYGFKVINEPFKVKTKNPYKESGNSYIYTSGFEI